MIPNKMESLTFDPSITYWINQPKKKFPQIPEFKINGK